MPRDVVILMVLGHCHFINLILPQLPSLRNWVVVEFMQLTLAGVTQGIQVNVYSILFSQLPSTVGSSER